MIDIHAHVLPEVDDGAKSIEEAIEMIQEAIDNQVTGICLTPHYKLHNNYITSNIILQDKYKKVIEQGFKIDLFLGREIDHYDEILSKEELSKHLTLNSSKYILIEFTNQDTNIEDSVYEISLNGYVPVIAHVERYDQITDYSCYRKLKETGALLQVNASSIVMPKNKKIKKRMNYLLKHKLVDIIASDAHKPGDYESMSRCYQYIEKTYGYNYAEMIFVTNPKIVLNLEDKL